MNYAELQVTLKINGGSKSFILQLWPNRCNKQRTG